MITTRITIPICITFIQCWTKVEEVGPSFYKCYTNVLCLLGKKPLDFCNFYIVSNQFNITIIVFQK